MVDYARLLAFRTGLRRFLRWSEQEAIVEGLTGSQHQLLLVVKGCASQDGPTVGDVAEHLLIRHHSAGELIHRAQDAGLVRLRQDADDHRVARVTATARGERILAALAARHLEEIARLAPTLDILLKAE